MMRVIRVYRNRISVDLATVEYSAKRFYFSIGLGSHCIEMASYYLDLATQQ